MSFDIAEEWESLAFMQYTLYNIPGDPSNNVCLRFPEKNPYSKKPLLFSWNQQPRVFQKLSTWVVSFWQHFQFFFFCRGELAATLVWCAALIIFITLLFPLCVYRAATQNSILPMSGLTTIIIIMIVMIIFLWNVFCCKASAMQMILLCKRRHVFWVAFFLPILYRFGHFEQISE